MRLGVSPIVGWAVTLCCVSLALAGALVASGSVLGPWIPTALFALVAIVTERQSVQLSANVEISVSFLPFILAAALLGPISAMVVGAASVITLCRPPYVRWLIWTASRAFVCGTAAIAVLATGGVGATSFVGILPAVVAASAVEVLLDLSLGALTVSIRGSGSFRGQIKTTLPILLAAVPLYTPVAAVLVYAYREVSPWTFAFFVIPAFAAHRLFVLYREQRTTSEDLSAANVQLERANLSFATALVATLDARDRYTAGHSAAVAIYSRDIANRMGLGDEVARTAHLCGLVHDIGKVGLPAGLLEKPGPLTLSERRQMERHSEIGETILRKVENYADIASIVRHHHERFDGAGYPDGLAAAEIPILSRIIAVADAYNAMTSDRPYRDAMLSQVARMRLARAVESQFDTSVVAAFEAILAGASEDYRLGRRADFSLDSQEADAVPRPVITKIAV
jgi:putative nucleotidyltransferase with HDIG domain